MTFPRPQLLGVASFHAAVLLAPTVEGRRADAVTPTDVIRLRASLTLLQHANDLFFCETLPLHRSSPFVHSKVENSSSQWPGYRGEGHIQPSG